MMNIYFYYFEVNICTYTKVLNWFKKNGQKEIFLVQNCAVVYKVPPNGKKSKKGKGKVMQGKEME